MIVVGRSVFYKMTHWKARCGEDCPKVLQGDALRNLDINIFPYNIALEEQCARDDLSKAIQS